MGIEMLVERKVLKLYKAFLLQINLPQ
jgi:hypothetical protein